MCMFACGDGRGGGESAVLYSLCGGLRLVILMAEGRYFGAAAGGRKGPRKRCIFPKSDALLDIGVLTREKKGEKRCESSASLGVHHFHAKIGGNGGVAGACFRADSGHIIGAEVWLFAVGVLSKRYRFCTGFQNWAGREHPKPGCLPMYMKRVQFRGASQICDSPE